MPIAYGYFSLQRSLFASCVFSYRKPKCTMEKIIKIFIRKRKKVKPENWLSPFLWLGKQHQSKCFSTNLKSVYINIQSWVSSKCFSTNLGFFLPLAKQIAHISLKCGHSPKLFFLKKKKKKDFKAASTIRNLLLLFSIYSISSFHAVFLFLFYSSWWNP